MKLAKLFAAAARSAYWPVLAKGVLPTVEHRTPLAGIAPATVIDVGANKGQFSAFASREWPQAAIHAFEPIPDQADRYQAVMNGRATLHRCALAAEAGEMTLHMASRADSSSLLPLSEEQKRLFHMDEVGTITVPVARLDTLLSPTQVRAPALLKIDVQGFEYEVLRGIAGLVPQIRWIYVEASFVELYRGQRLYAEIADLLAELGYRPISRNNLSHDADGREIQADILFERAGNTKMQ